MRISKVKSAVLSGYQTQPIFIEAIKTRGNSQLLLSGLPDVYLKDSKDKIKTLVSNLVPWEQLDKILAHIIPAETEKIGAHLELPLAIACLLALDPIGFSKNSLQDLENLYFFGALTLEGEIQSTRACEVLADDLKGQCIGPNQVQNISTLFQAIHTGSLTSLAQLQIQRQAVELDRSSSPSFLSSFNENSFPIKGLIWEKFWIGAAAVSRSPVLLMGTPGVGKSTLAKWASDILPQSENQEVLAETKKIWRLANTELPNDCVPKLFPHPRSHISEFLGTKNKIKMIQPGYFSLAHGGVLVLDEFLELNRDCREILRNILETKKILKRSPTETSQWPADFWLITTSNPCPCGYLEGQFYENCRCSQNQLRQYQNRLSGPLWDRFGLRLFLKRKPKFNKDNLIPEAIQKLFLANDTIQIKSLILDARKNWDQSDQETVHLAQKKFHGTEITFRELKAAIMAVHSAHLVYKLPKDLLLDLWQHKNAFENQTLSHYSTANNSRL